MQLFVDLVGWLGALAVLVAYGLISAGRLEGSSGWYQGLNLLGAVGLALNTLFYTAYPSAMVNIIWAGIAVAALYRYRRRPPLPPPCG